MGTGGREASFCLGDELTSLLGKVEAIYPDDGG